MEYSPPTGSPRVPADFQPLKILPTLQANRAGLGNNKRYSFGEISFMEYSPPTGSPREAPKLCLPAFEDIANSSTTWRGKC